MGQYLPILALGVLAVVFCALSFVASRLMAPRRPTRAKNAPYECGIVSQVEIPERFPVRFFLVAMIFIVFDVEIVFLYPWAVTHGALGLFGLVAIGIFSFAVFESFVYLISKGALDWGPLRAPRAEGAVDAARTSADTIRRVPPSDSQPGLPTAAAAAPPESPVS
ncbi:MAG: NADH-quinone oxidoreductase subunit A [Acidimicrobiia bacterium]|nr:NADH-quinone oxidoreductase subunit A [Acidimicrobiia bacterium]